MMPYKVAISLDSNYWQKRRHSVPHLQYFCMILAVIGWLSLYESMKLNKFSRVVWSAEQYFKRWLVSSVVLHDGDSLHAPEVSDQWLVSAAMRYRPESRRACWVAITTLVGEAAAVVQMGCGDISDIKVGLKNCKKDRLPASWWSFCSQKSITCFFTSILYFSLVRGDSKSTEGWGNLYCRQRSQILWNHDLGDHGEYILSMTV